MKRSNRIENLLRLGFRSRGSFRIDFFFVIAANRSDGAVGCIFQLNALGPLGPLIDPSLDELNL